MPKSVVVLALELSISEAFQMVSIPNLKEESEDLFLSFLEGANLFEIRINVISNVYALHSKLSMYIQRIKRRRRISQSFSVLFDLFR